MFFHEHGPDADHDHDDEFFNGPIEENPLWIADNVVLNSVGIDVGSSGTQVIFLVFISAVWLKICLVATLS